FSAGTVGSTKTYQTDYLLDPQTIAPGTTGTAQARLFAGAKEVSVIDSYEKALHLNRFELLIDWGWFYFITKPMFKLIDYFYRLVGNFGVALLIVNVLVQMQAVRERYPDDKVKQQQEMMELYKKEKINPLAGCLPIVIQIPVFFSLYKVLFVTIEMRHAPFFGWIHDLSAPDPTSFANLFGLLPFAPPHILMIGAWPLIMGLTMFLQQKLNPQPVDPVQAR